MVLTSSCGCRAPRADAALDVTCSANSALSKLTFAANKRQCSGGIDVFKAVKAAICDKKFTHWFVPERHSAFLSTRRKT